MKNTAKYIFNAHQMDLSEKSLRALEAQVLSLSKAEVCKTV
jgi:hypothetical protein